MRRLALSLAIIFFVATYGLSQTQVETPHRPQRIRVAAAVISAFIEHETTPEYPSAALRAGNKGDVIFKILVNEMGKVTECVPVEGDALLVGVSIETIRDMHFRPYLLNGSPIQVESQLGFHYTIQGEGDNARGKVERMSSVPYRPEFRTGSVNDHGILILSPREISGGEPQLPTELAGKAGSVYLTITIGTDGKVQDVKVLGGDQLFIAPVVSAVKQFVYEPQLVDGKPTVSTIEASYHFGPR